MKSSHKVLGVVLLATATTVMADTLPPGIWTALPGTTVAAQPFLAGVVLEDVVQPFSFAAYGGTVSGSVQSRVVKEDGTGTLDFYWRVINDPNSSGRIGELRIGNFVAPEYDGNYRIDGLGNVGPSQAFHFDTPKLSYVNFSFANPSNPDDRTAQLLAGGESKFILLHTSATTYNKTAFYDLANVGESQISDGFATFTPGAVPEPSSYALIGGLALVSFAAWRRIKS